MVTKQRCIGPKNNPMQTNRQCLHELRLNHLYSREPTVPLRPLPAGNRRFPCKPSLKKEGGVKEVVLQGLIARLLSYLVSC